MWGKIRNIINYAGLEKEDYLEIKPVLTESNRKSMLVYTIMAIGVMAVMIGMSFFDDSLVKNRQAYLIGILISAVLLLVNVRLSKDRPVLVYGSVYTFVLVLFAFGTALGTFVEPNEVSVSFPVLLFAVPLLFADIPTHMNISIIIGIVMYVICAKMTQDPIMMGYNLSNILPYGALSIIVSTYMTDIKFRRYALERKNKYLSESDQLTGLENRRSYEQHLGALKEKETIGDLTIVALDINGLKTVNDNMGHQAGDEMICGAADCMKAAFENYGRCYRTGGDEFMAILEGPVPAADELALALNKQTERWKGTLVSGISISIGIVSASANPGLSVDELVQKADKEMYAYKNDYYRRTGINRRRV